MYSIIYKKTAEKELFSLPDEYVSKIRNIINQLASNPRPFGCKKLFGSLNEYRIRVGIYRVIYTITDEALIVYVIKIGHRKEVYR